MPGSAVTLPLYRNTAPCRAGLKKALLSQINLFYLGLHWKNSGFRLKNELRVGWEGGGGQYFLQPSIRETKPCSPPSLRLKLTLSSCLSVSFYSTTGCTLLSPRRLGCKQDGSRSVCLQLSPFKETDTHFSPKNS